MEISFNWLAFLLLAGAVHALFLAVTLFNIQGGNHSANRFLAIILIVFVFLISLHLLSHTNTLLRYPHFSKIASPIEFLLSPLFYFYVLALTRNQFRPDKKTLFHFVPFLTVIAYNTPYYLQPADYKGAHIIADYQGTCITCHLNYWLLMIQIIIYTLFAIKILFTHHNRIKDSFSSLEKINLTWLIFLLIGFSVTWILSLLLKFFAVYQDTNSYIWLAVSINIYLIGLFGLRQPLVFSGANNTTSVTLREPEKKYKKSTLKPEKEEEYLEKLIHFMKTEKPFLNGDLNLQELARKLSISHHHLSQVINEKLHQNFFEFVNSHRVNEAKELLAKPENRNLNLAQIGFNAGFNSISAFNAAFKKYTGMTPSQYFDQTSSK